MLKPLLIVLIALSFLARASPLIEEVEVTYYVSAARGLWLGFMKGFYPTQGMTYSSRCLDEDFGSKLTHAINSFYQTYADNQLWYYEIITDSTVIWAEIEDCNLSYPLFDYYNYCLVKS